MYQLTAMTKLVMRQLLKPAARKKLASLSLSNDPDVSKLSHAILDALNKKFNANEMEWINKIETIRNKMQDDSSVISITDYGAGKPSDNRTEQEMLKGFKVDLTISELSRASKPQFWACILFKLVRHFKPKNGLELGTCVGISGAYEASAQVLNDSNNGSMITLEGSDSTANLASNNFKKLGLDNITVVTGKFEDTLDAVLKTNENFDYVFIDGHHDEHATIKYFDKIIPRLSERALVIFDDIAWSEGMKRAWEKIASYENVSISFNLRTIGVCLLRSNNSDKFDCKLKLI